MPKNLDKLIFIVVNVLVILAVTFAVGLHSGVSKNFLYRAIEDASSALDQFWIEKVKGGMSGEPVYFLQPATRPGNAVTVNEREDDGGLILLSGFMEGGNQLRLIRRDGSLVAKWPVRFSEHFPDPAHLETPPVTDWNVDLHGALALSDGSVLFNYEYSGTVKLSRCGEVVWTLPHNTHHSLELSETGGFWIPGREYFPPTDRGRFPPFTQLGGPDKYADDLILKVSDDGQILLRKSVPEILADNGLVALLTATGQDLGPGWFIDSELVHLNMIAELPAAIAGAFPGFEAGDLLLSLRNYNLVFVVDPDTWRIKWHRTGPYVRQHDPEFGADGTITVFNNNAYLVDDDPRTAGGRREPRLSNIIRVDPATGAATIAYGGRPEQAFFSVIRGKHQPLPGGGFLITDFQGGRAFETDADGRLVWEYVNRYDENRVLELTEARLYPADYFSVEDWSCP